MPELRRRISASSEEDVLELRAVAEAPKFRAHGGAVAAVLAERHVAHVGLPASRVRALGQSGAAAAAERRRVLVTVIAELGRLAPEQASSARIGTNSVEHEHLGPAPADSPFGVAFDVRILGR